MCDVMNVSMEKSLHRSLLVCVNGFCGSCHLVESVKNVNNAEVICRARYVWWLALVTIFDGCFNKWNIINWRGITCIHGILYWMLTISYAFCSRLYPFKQDISAHIAVTGMVAPRAMRKFDFCIESKYTHCRYNGDIASKTYMYWRYKLTRHSLTISVMRCGVLYPTKATHHNISLKYDYCPITRVRSPDPLHFN